MRKAAVKLLVSDVDGTLVRDDKSLSSRNAEAIARLRRAGIKVSLISARPPAGLGWLADELELDGPFGAFNGGTLFMADGAITRAERLPDGLGGEIVGSIREAGIDAWVFLRNRWLVQDTDNPHVPRERRSSGLEPTVQRDLGAIDGPVDKVVAVSDDHAAVSRLEEIARDRFGNRATVKRSHSYYLDFTAPGANKGDGVAAIAQAMGVPLEQTLAIGDGPNDMAMFARVGASIAMGNADKDVRQAATATTASNEEDGVAQAIDRLLEEMAA